MRLVTLLALVLTINACSLSDSKKEEVAVQQDDLEFAVDTLNDETTNTTNSEIKVEEQKIAESAIPDEYQAPPVEEPEMIAPVEPTFGEFANNNSPVEAPAEIKTETINPAPAYGALETYQVQKGDTLMMIAFKIYGDYRKWKELKEWNKDKVKFSEGMSVKYYVPDQKFGWMPSGLPHMVKTGETLQIISMDKYGTTKKWKAIYENNHPLIRNPNLIFAGFTIYYHPNRDLASEPK